MQFTTLKFVGGGRGGRAAGKLCRVIKLLAMCREVDL